MLQPDFTKLINKKFTGISSWPHYAKDEIAAVSQVLQSGKVNYWTGTECRKFEEEFADYIGANHAVTLANGSVALELALTILDIGPGDEVIVTARSFVASASSILRVGATPIFADVDSDSQNISAETIAPKITPRTKAIITVHLAGWPCDMQPILELANRHKLKVIEDCAQAHGSSINRQKVGTFGHCAVFSFCQDKIMSTGGEGGMLTTNSSELWEKAWSFKDHGKDYSKSVVDKSDGKSQFKWLHDSLGTNFRMTEMQAAIGRLQLTKLDNWLKIRNEHAEKLREKLSGIDILRIPQPPADFLHAYYKFYCFVNATPEQTLQARIKILNQLAARGVPVFTGSCSEIYLEKMFSDAGPPPTELHTTKMLGKTSLMFLVHPTIKSSEMNLMAETIYRTLSAEIP